MIIRDYVVILDGWMDGEIYEILKENHGNNSPVYL